MKPIYRKRLRKLAEYLLTQVPQDKFDMSYYRTGGDMDHVCGTAGCALGWSPAIMSKKTYYKYRSTGCSIGTMFEKISNNYLGIESDTVWSYIFSEYWAYKDNTPQGAAARIPYFLDHGVPD